MGSIPGVLTKGGREGDKPSSFLTKLRSTWPTRHKAGLRIMLDRAEGMDQLAELIKMAADGIRSDVEELQKPKDKGGNND